MRWIIGSSLKFRFLVVAIAAAMMVFGTQQLRTMPVDAFPEFAPPRVEIQTICLGLSAAEVESLVSIPLEQSLNGIDGLDVIRSKSVPQLSSVELLFKDGHRHPARAPARAGARRSGDAEAADLGGAAVHDAADLDHEPRGQDRRLVEDRRHHPALDDRVLEDQGATPAGPRRGQRRDLGRAPPAAARARSTRRGCASATSALEHVMEAHLRRARRGPAALLGRRRDRDRRLHRHAEPAARRSSTSSRSCSRATSLRSRSRPAATGRSGSATSRRW